MANDKTQKADNAYGKTLDNLNGLVQQYSAFMPGGQIYAAFRQAALNMANQPQIQNARIKAISSLPADYTKEDIGSFLQNPYGSEKPLRATSEVLKWTAYPYFKIGKTYQDIPTYRHYSKPLYLTAEEAKSKEFLREATLINKITRALKPEQCAHKITGQAVTQGKVFYTLRTDIDKAHNKVNYAFMQQLPEDWCYIIGYNNISGYTVSFDLMYFLTPGTDYRQYGDLFAPYMGDFQEMFQSPAGQRKNPKYVYGSDGDTELKYTFYPERVKANAAGSPKVREFEQSGRWEYYVTLPIDKVWTFEIDDTTPAVAPPIAGLMLTYAQQSDYEAAQLSLLLNPLIKIFTGEIPYFDDAGTQKDDNFRLTLGGRAMFETFFQVLMEANNTAGSAIYTAPLQNIRSHDFTESANANAISESFNRYGIEKAGLAAIFPVANDIKASQVDAACRVEGRFTTATIYAQFEQMMNNLYENLNLRFEWQFVMFGTIFNEDKLRENAQKAITNGDISAHFILSALDGESWIEKLAMMNIVKESGLLNMLIPPITSYTMKQETSGLPPQSPGRPPTDELTDTKEKNIDFSDGE